MAVLLSGAVVGSSGLLRPNAVRLHAGLGLGADAVSLVVVGFLVRAHSWIQFAAPGSASAGIEEADKWTNVGMWVSLMIIGAIVLAHGVRDGRRLFHRKSKPLHCLAGLAFLLICLSRGASPI